MLFFLRPPAALTGRTATRRTTLEHVPGMEALLSGTLTRGGKVFLTEQ